MGSLAQDRPYLGMDGCECHRTLTADPDALDDTFLISQLEQLLNGSQHLVILVRVGFAFLILIQPILSALSRQSSGMVSLSLRNPLVRDELDVMQIYDIKVAGVQTPEAACNAALDRLRGIVESSRVAPDFCYLRPKR